MPERNTPKDPVQFRTRTPATTESQTDTVPDDLAKLARQAFEEKRLRDCLATTAAILKIDPQHVQAQVIQSWVLADLDQQSKHAHTVAEEARKQNNSRLWHEVAATVRSILSIDPENEGAKALLSEVLSIQDLALSPIKDNANVYDGVPGSNMSPDAFDWLPPAQKKRKWLLPVGIGAAAIVVAVLGYFESRVPRSSTLAPPTSASNTPSGSQGSLSIQVDDGVQVFVDDQNRGTAPIPPLMLPVGKHQLRYEANGLVLGQEEVVIQSNMLATNKLEQVVGRLDLVVVPMDGVQLTLDNANIGIPPPFVLLKPGVHSLAFSAAGRVPEVRSVTVIAGERRLVPVLMRDASLAATAPASNSSPAAATTSATPAAARPQTNGITGKLSISSPFPADIYFDGRRVDSTPTTLEFPPGERTLEYRYENLRKTIKHVIKAGETTTVNVVFEVTVQINAQPWANVFVQENPVRSLGQTPLSGVPLAVGSVLIFRNPQFPEKTYRVTAKDTAVQISLQ